MLRFVFWEEEAGHIRSCLGLLSTVAELRTPKGVEGSMRFVQTFVMGTADRGPTEVEEGMIGLELVKELARAAEGNTAGFDPSRQPVHNAARTEAEDNPEIALMEAEGEAAAAAAAARSGKTIDRPRTSFEGYTAAAVGRRQGQGHRPPKAVVVGETVG